MSRVVITGIAPVICNCYDKNEFFEALFAMRKFAQPADNDMCRGYELKTKWIVPYTGLDQAIEHDKRLFKLENRSNPNAVLSVYAAEKAVEDAGIEKLDENTAVIIGSSLNTGEVVHESGLVIDGRRISPLAVPKAMPNSSAGYISIMLGLHGETKNVCTACASGTTAIGDSYRLIKSGGAKTVICGGTECLKDELGLTIRGFDTLKTLTRSEDGNPRCFSEDRSGFLINEGGACCLVLEEYEQAVSRGADIYCEITGYEANSDAYSITSILPDPVYGKAIVSKLAEGKKIDLYNSHGTGTIVNDGAEAVLIREIWGSADKQPYINATKGIIGHSVSASGAVEAAVCAYSIKHGRIHGNLVGKPMEELNLPLESFETDVNTAISASFGFGGHNAALRFEKL